MKNGRPQAKDFDDLTVLRAISALRKPNETCAKLGLGHVWTWVNRWDLEAATGMPEKVCLAKLGALDRKKLIEACNCGCRGDIELTEAGEAFLSARVG